MFSENQINAYRAVTAPAELRARVLSAAQTTHVRKLPQYTHYAALAACLVLCIALSVWFTTGRDTAPVIAVNSAALTAQPMTLTGKSNKSRTWDASSGITVPLHVTVSRKTEITAYTGTLTDGNRSVTLTQAATLQWQVPYLPTDEAVSLVLRDGRTETTVWLAYTDVNDVWTIWMTQSD